MRSVNRLLATTTSVRSDDVWVVVPVPVECGRSRETVKHSDLAGWAELRERPRQTLIGNKNYFGRGFERELSEHGVQLLRPTRRGERERTGAALFEPLRQVIESINETFKGQPDLGRYRGRTPEVSWLASCNASSR